MTLFAIKYLSSQRHVIQMVALALIGGLLMTNSHSDEIPVFDRHSDYISQGRFDGWERHSAYVTVKDGTKIAVDYYLPTVKSKFINHSYPAVFHYTRYTRAAVREDGTIDSIVTRGDYSSDLLLSHGYVIVVADVRGTGSSFGSRNGEFSKPEIEDSSDLIQWIAGQPWSNGKVGMIGASYPGLTQYLAASKHPQNLVAIFPEASTTHLYDYVYHGGTYKAPFVTVWGDKTRDSDMGGNAPEPLCSKKLLGKALIEHQENIWVTDYFPDAPYRDTELELSKNFKWRWQDTHAMTYLDEIDSSGIAIYHLAGWFDGFPDQQIELFANLKNTPQKLAIGPWPHTAIRRSGFARIERLRWFDYWLKGINNGIMDEPPITYFTMLDNNTITQKSGKNSNEKTNHTINGNWKTAPSWPPINTKAVNMSFCSSNLLKNQCDEYSNNNDENNMSSKTDTYQVDYTTTSSSSPTQNKFSRWSNIAGIKRPDGTTFFDTRNAQDKKTLNYTSKTLTEEAIITGHPIVNLWISTDNEDVDIFVYLEEIDDKGVSHYLTEGSLRASYRKTAIAPYNNFDLPYHPSNSHDIVDMPKDPVLMPIAMYPISAIVQPGHKIRISIAGADRDNFALYPDPEGIKSPIITVYHSSEYQSHVVLPMEMEEL